MDNFGRQMTFWSLINEYNIRIPIIQRDYVQGRNKDQVKDARQNLLDDMCRAIEDGRLDLNFVYGKVHSDENSTVFIPLDGQQRLTTLFLLHWFALVKAKADDTQMQMLLKFSYETRASSKRFFKDLVNNAQSLGDAFGELDILSEKIKDEAWFWVDWIHDPTIVSALIMLDEIKERFGDIENLADKLISGDSISFRFLNMQDLGMEDSLYIKLNARGRQLTDFENFKAEIDKYVKNEAMDGKVKIDYSKKLDGEWADMFWQWTGRAGKPEEFDKVYMRCFHWVLWNRWAEMQKQVEKSNASITAAMNKTEYYRLSEYKDKGAIDGKVLEHLFYTLEYFSSSTPTPDSNTIEYLKYCILPAVQKDITYEDRVMLFAVTCYLGYQKGDVDPKAFQDWLRILGNLVRNAYMDGLDIFVRAIQSVSKLASEHTIDLLQYFASPDCPTTISGFIGEQVEEESLKARLILRSKDWAKAIYDAEKHTYFAGQIAFLFSFAGLHLETIDRLDDSELNDSLNRFLAYKKKMWALFSNEKLSIDDDLFSRAILSKGDYLLPFNKCKSFLVNLNRSISWRVLLKNRCRDKRLFLQEVLDELDETDLSKDNIEQTMKKIIEDAYINVNDWRYYFVKIGGLIKQCGSYRLIYPSNSRILLVPCQTTAGYNREYYTYVVCLKLRTAGKKVVESPDRGQDGSPHISKIDDKDMRIEYKNGKFKIDYNGQTQLKDSIDDLTNFCFNLS